MKVLLHSFIRASTVNYGQENWSALLIGFTEMIGFLLTVFLFRIQMREYCSVLSLSFVAGSSFIKVGQVLGNVDTDMHVCLKCSADSTVH